MSKKPTVVKNFVNICSITFKAFDFEVVMNASKSTLWNFTTYYPERDKKYAVMCVPDILKAKALIKIAIKKVPAGQRLVIVTSGYTDEDLEIARSNDYCLVSLPELKKYGDDMLVAREHESQIKGTSESFVDQVINKD
jgi:hypothetical protein